MASRSSAVSSGEYSATTPASAKAAGPLAVAGAADAMEAPAVRSETTMAASLPDFIFISLSDACAFRTTEGLLRQRRIFRVANGRPRCAVPFGQGGPLSKALARPSHRRHICGRDVKIAETKTPRKLHGGHADRLRYSSRGGRNPHHAAALSRRPLERAGGQPRHRWPRSQLLSPQHAVLGPRRLAAGPRQTGQWQARQRTRDGAARRVRPARCEPCDLQRGLRRAGGVRFLYGGRVLQGDQRLDRGRMAFEGFKAERLDRGA